MNNNDDFFNAVVAGSRTREDQLAQMLLANLGMSFGGVDIGGIAMMNLTRQEDRLALLAEPGTAPQMRALIPEEQQRYAAQRKAMRDVLGARFDALYAEARASEAAQRAVNKRPPLPEFNEDGTVK
jgi:hypothetical protein